MAHVFSLEFYWVKLKITQIRLRMPAILDIHIFPRERDFPANFYSLHCSQMRLSLEANESLERI